MNRLALDEAIKNWLIEDIGEGDLTTEALIPEGAVTTGIIHAKASGVLCGVDVAREVFRVLDPTLTYTAKLQDGAKVENKSIIAEVSGNARNVLTGERLALNLMQHLSAIATHTAAFMDIIKGTGAYVVDTRKTTPGLRMLEKYAVTVGGGKNHRLGLYDAILIKDNHIEVAGNITEALRRAKAHVGHMTKVEIEVENLDQCKEALAAGADVIMLDNMSPEHMKECVAYINHRAKVEASGGINEDTIRAAAESGVDVVSIGALTHTVKALDISMDIGKIKG